MTMEYSVVSEFEGTLLKEKDLFSYFMLLAFDASGLIRFTILLLLWPIIALLDVLSYNNTSLKLMIFVATVGLREGEIVSAARAVLPKIYMDDLSMDTWRVFSLCNKKVVVTRMPRVMVESFAKEHLKADAVIGTELIVSRFGFFTGLIRENNIDQSISNSVSKLFGDRRPHLGLGRPASKASKSFLSLCEEQIHESVHWIGYKQQLEVQPPKPVIFHDASLVKRPTPATALLILLWLPVGLVLASIRMFITFVSPFWIMPYALSLTGFCVTIVKGTPPLAKSSGGVLYVCNHRTALDPMIVSFALGRSIPAVVSFKIPKLFRILCPVPMVFFTRSREDDAAKMKQELAKGDLAVCPEGCNCYQPFVLRFSAMFAEITDRIVPVAFNCRLGFFRPRVRSWNGLRTLMLIFMNPTVLYELTFLDQLPVEATCSSGRSPYDVANHVQRVLADTLGFGRSNLGRKEWFELLR